MIRSILTAGVLALFAAGCDGDKGEAHSDEASEHGKETEGHGEQHENEAHLTPEAIERAGIRVGAAERRALTGGVAIPAEIQFDPSSTAHVAPLVPGRITKV